jgi:putative sterol carrier protein
VISLQVRYHTLVKTRALLLLLSGAAIVHDAVAMRQGELKADSCDSIVTLSLSDDDFGKLVSGKANAQRLFMGGKLKAKGDVMKATKLEGVLAKARPATAKL